MGFREDVRKVKALADENRLAIMLALQHGEKCGCISLSQHFLIICRSSLLENFYAFEIRANGCIIPSPVKELRAFVIWWQPMPVAIAKRMKL